MEIEIWKQFKNIECTFSTYTIIVLMFTFAFVLMFYIYGIKFNIISWLLEATIADAMIPVCRGRKITKET